MIGRGLISPTLVTGHYPALAPSSGTQLYTDLTHTQQTLASFLNGALQHLLWETHLPLLCSPRGAGKGQGGGSYLDWGERTQLCLLSTAPVFSSVLTKV